MAREESKGFTFYRCTKSFALPYFDEDGHECEDKKCYVEKGDIFRRTSANYLGCEVHLEQEPLGNWIEISKAKLAECFVPKEGDGNAVD